MLRITALDSSRVRVSSESICYSWWSTWREIRRTERASTISTEIFHWKKARVPKETTRAARKRKIGNLQVKRRSPGWVSNLLENVDRESRRREACPMKIVPPGFCFFQAFIHPYYLLQSAVIFGFRARHLQSSEPWHHLLVT